jgi:hypothetical protein
MLTILDEIVLVVTELKTCSQRVFHDGCTKALKKMKDLPHATQLMTNGALFELGQALGLQAYGEIVGYQSHNKIAALIARLEKDIPAQFGAARQVVQEFKENLTAARTSMVSPIKESHLRHIKAQAQKWT